MLRRIASTLILVAGVISWPVPAGAAVVVIANRTGQTVGVRETGLADPAPVRLIPSGDVLAIAISRPVGVEFHAGSFRDEYLLDPDTAYELRATGDEEPSLVRIDLSIPDPDIPPPPPDPNDDLSPGLLEFKVVSIPVLLLVDEEELFVRSFWEKRLTARLAKASAIIEKQCGIRFEAVATDIWRSTNQIPSFAGLLREFEQDVDPAPARLAIGFTSQSRAPQDRNRIGGTRSPLRRHLLIREWSKSMSEPERLELLLHELGHYLGATHTPDMGSVMRPRIADGLARVSRFRIQFDAVNTLAMNVIADEIRDNQLRKFEDVSESGRERLSAIYRELLRANPEDTGNLLSIELVSSLGEPDGSHLRDTGDQPPGSIAGRPRSTTRPSSVDFLSGGDSRTEDFVREAAAVAAQLPDETSPTAFLLDLGLTLDNTGLLKRFTALGDAGPAIDHVRMQESRRRATTRGLTMRRRPDLTQHFCVSAALVVLVGESSARSIGVAKELRDSDGGSGFSFADLAADLAGIEFAKRVLRSELRLDQVARTFRVLDFLPEWSDLPEGLTKEEFSRRYSSASSPGFRQQESELRKRILALPGFKTSGAQQPQLRTAP